jgi:phosphohistidine swiveling domain-containing protein
MTDSICSWDSVNCPQANSFTTANTEEILPGIALPLPADLIRDWMCKNWESIAEYYRGIDLIPYLSPQGANVFSLIGGRFVINIAVVNAFTALYQVGEGSDWLKQFLPGEEELQSGSEEDQERAQLARERAFNRWRENRYFTSRESGESKAAYLFSLRRNWSLLEDIELVESIGDTIILAARAYGTHSFNSMGGGELTTIVDSLLDEYIPGHPKEWITILTSGLTDVESNRPTKAIWDFSRLILESSVLVEDFRSLGSSVLLENLKNPPSSTWKLLGGRFTELQEDLGYRGQGELNPQVPTWNERPEFIVGNIKSSLDLPEDRNPYGRELIQKKVREDLEQKIFTQLPESVHGEFRENLVLAQTLNRDRETGKASCVRYTRMFRPPILELGIRLRDKGLLVTEDDVWWLRLSELQDLVSRSAKNRTIQEAIKLRKEELEFLEQHDLPVLFELPVEPVPIVVPEVLQEAISLQGLGVSQGIVRGKARVVESALAAVEAELEPGEILVAPFTDAGWTPLFVSAGGVVVETGGMLSHAATVAREYGLPAVVNIEGATSMIPNGAMVSINGATGVVEVIL